MLMNLMETGLNMAMGRGRGVGVGRHRKGMDAFRRRVVRKVGLRKVFIVLLDGRNRDEGKDHTSSTRA